jgi:hypothetical protein
MRPHAHVQAAIQKQTGCLEAQCPVLALLIGADNADQEGILGESAKPGFGEVFACLFSRVAAERLGIDAVGQVVGVSGNPRRKLAVLDHAVKAVAGLRNRVGKPSIRPFSVNCPVKPLLHMLALGKAAQMRHGRGCRIPKPVEPGSVPDGHQHPFLALGEVIPDGGKLWDEPILDRGEVVLAERNRS